MAGAKDMKARNAGFREALLAGARPASPAPETPAEEQADKAAPNVPRTGLGQNTFWQEFYQKEILEAQTRAEAAEAEVARLKASNGSKEDLVEAHRKLAEAEAALATALENQPRRKAKLDELHEVPGRRRRLTPEQYNELRENLAHNPLAHPVTVRIRPEGGYEIVSGNNRTSIYRELGREEIDITVLELNDDEVDRTAFYSNLLAPTLTDFEKFQGFKSRMEKKGLNQTQVAAEAGVSQPYISALMAFDELPAEALESIAEAPAKFGAKAIQELAKLTKQGKGAKVIEAVQKVVTDELNQSAAVHHAKAADTPKPTRPTPVTIRQGKAKYCEAVRRDKAISLSFASAEEAAATFDAIQAFLKQRAEAGKK